MMNPIKYLTLEEYDDNENWKDVCMICFGKDIMSKGDVVFKKDGLYEIKHEIGEDDSGRIFYVELPNSKTCCEVPFMDEMRFVTFYQHEYDSYIRKIKRENKKANEVKISKQRYDELLEIEAKYENLCK